MKNNTVKNIIIRRISCLIISTTFLLTVLAGCESSGELTEITKEESTKTQTTESQTTKNHTDGSADESVAETEGEEKTVVDLVIFMGQSNMAGRGDALEAPVVQEGHGYEFRAVSDPTRLYNISEPFGVNENRGVVTENKKTGSLVSAFVESYYAQTGVPIVGVSSSKGGTGIDYWNVGGDALNESILRYTAAERYLLDNGYSIRHRYMVWLQGETDGVNGMSAESYKRHLTSIFEEMNTHGIEKCMVIRIGNNSDNATENDKIILAQTKLCAEHDDFVLISGKLAYMAEANLMKDKYHYKQEGYNIVGEDAGANMAFYVNTGKEPRFYDTEYENFYPYGTINNS